MADEEPFDPRAARYDFLVTGADLFAFTGLPYVMDFMAEEAPGVSLTVVPRRNDTLDRMERGEIHYAFGPSFPPRAGLRQVKLFEEPFVVMGRHRHPAFRGGLTLDAYLAAEHVLVAPGGRPGGFVDDALAERGLRRRVVIRVAHFTPAPSLVVRSDLLLTGPESLAREAAKTLPLSQRPVPLELPPVSSLMAWHERFDRDPAHRWFRDAIQRYIAQR